MQKGSFEKTCYSSTASCRLAFHLGRPLFKTGCGWNQVVQARQEHMSQLPLVLQRDWGWHVLRGSCESSGRQRAGAPSSGLSTGASSSGDTALSRPHRTLWKEETAHPASTFSKPDSSCFKPSSFSSSLLHSRLLLYLFQKMSSLYYDCPPKCERLWCVLAEP